MAVVKTLPSIEEAHLAFSHSRNRIGSGSFREVYRLPNSYWAYKRDKSRYSKTDGNKAEWSNYKRLITTAIPANIRLPEMFMLSNGILAVQFIEGKVPTQEFCYPDYHCCDEQDSCFWTIYGEALENLVGDMHSYNVIIDQLGNIYMIDLGSLV
jgi:serine/threonine-protein kinase RIO1